MKTIKVEPLPEYEYPRSDRNQDFMREVVLACLDSLLTKYGPPRMRDVAALVSWSDVLVRHLYQLGPAHFVDDVTLIAPIPYDFGSIAKEYLNLGAFPEWLVNPTDSGEGIDYLRRLTRDFPFGEPPKN
jgi:hypothetical protein